MAILSKDWISAETEVGLPLIDDATAVGDHGLALSPGGSEPVIIQRMTLEEKAEIVVTPQLDLRVLRGSRDQGDRRHLRFRASSRNRIRGLAPPRQSGHEGVSHKHP